MEVCRRTRVIHSEDFNHIILTLLSSLSLILFSLFFLLNFSCPQSTIRNVIIVMSSIIVIKPIFSRENIIVPVARRQTTIVLFSDCSFLFDFHASIHS